MADPSDRNHVLDLVEAHEERFLGLWVLDCLIEERHFYQKLSLDLQNDPTEPSSPHDGWSING